MAHGIAEHVDQDLDDGVRLAFDAARRVGAADRDRDVALVGERLD